MVAGGCMAADYPRLIISGRRSPLDVWLLLSIGPAPVKKQNLYRRDNWNKSELENTKNQTRTFSVIANIEYRRDLHSQDPMETGREVRKPLLWVPNRVVRPTWWWRARFEDAV